jgi:YfiH family protein
VHTLDRHRDEAGLEAIESDALSGDGLAHGFFTRKGGVSAGLYESLNAGRGSADAADAVDENRRRIAARLGVPADALLTMHQVHSAEVATVTEPPPGRPRVDAMVTRTPDLALGVLTADCAPVLLVDTAARVVGAAHAGWRGAVCGILEATVEAMDALGARPAATAAVIGPTIGSASYEVGPELVERVLAVSPDAGDLFAPSPRDGHHMFDLPAYAARRLRGAGVGSVTDLALDTYADEDRFFSYRRATHRGEPDYGRLISAIALRG